ncbi:MAG TPA: hypothetical protein VM100_02020 [Longimicrobiales bacterium]|nr:hypothetical protein [Longimicrobiales bacterium]
MSQQIFFPLWIGLLAIGGPFFWFYRDNRLKRSVFPWYMGAMVTVFGTYAFGMMAPIKKDQLVETIFFFVVLVMVWIITVRSTKWCDDCGKMVTDQSMFRGRVKFCPRCGAALDGAVRPEEKNTIGRMS